MVLREWIEGVPLLQRTAWAIRMIALTGPWQPLLLRLYRSASRPPPPRCAMSMWPDADPLAVAEQLQRDGWTLAPAVPDAVVDEIMSFIGTQGSGPRHDDPHRHCRAVWRVAHDPQVLAVARHYLGADPIVHNSVIWRTRGIGDASHFSHMHIFRFHFDVADIKSLVLFVYLTDVDETNGPHVVIRGTHRRKSLWATLKLYLDDAIAQQRFGRRIDQITGARGTAFFEEQTAYHKQLMPRRPRTMLRITYTLARRSAIAAEPQA